MSEQTTADAEDGVRDHLADVADGSGCTEIWETLERRRNEDAGEPEPSAAATSDD